MNQAYARGFVKECSTRMVKRGQGVTNGIASTNIPPPMVTNFDGNVSIDPKFVGDAISNNAARIQQSNKVSRTKINNAPVAHGGF